MTDTIEEAKQFMRRTKHGLRAGDTIKCHDNNDAIETMQELSKYGIDTDFIYEKNGEKGLWLQVTKIGR